MDPDDQKAADYFREEWKDVPDDPNCWEPDLDMQNTILQQIKDRYIKERVAGFEKDGTVYLPLSPEAAAQAWEKAAPKFISLVSQFDVEMARSIYTFKPRPDYLPKQAG